MAKAENLIEGGDWRLGQLGSVEGEFYLLQPWVLEM